MSFPQRSSGAKPMRRGICVNRRLNTGEIRPTKANRTTNEKIKMILKTPRRYKSSKTTLSKHEDGEITKMMMAT